MKPRWLDAAVPVALALYGLAVASWPMLTSGFGLMEVDPADTRLIHYVLEHDHRWLLGQVPSLWDPAFFFPERGVGAFTEVNLTAAPFYSAWRLVGFLPDTSFQLWMLTMLALNFVAAWLLFRRALGLELWAAGAGAFLVAFANQRLAELNHQHLLPHFFTFLALHGLVRLLRGAPRPRFWLFTLFASVVLQIAANLTLGWFLCFGLLVALVWTCAIRPARAALFAALRPHWGALVLGAAASGLALWPVVAPFFAASRAVGARDWGETALFLPQLQSWFFQGPHNWLTGWMAGLSLYTRLNGGGPRLGLGFLTTAVVVITFWRERQNPWLRVAGLTSLTLIALVTMYRGWVSPWQWVAAVVPGANGIRAVGRIGLLLLVPAGVALATFVQRSPRRWVGLVVAALCVLEQGARVPDSYDKLDVRRTVAALAAAIPPGCRAFFYAPVGQPKYDEKTQLDAMWAQAESGVPTANGYSGHFPPGWDLMEHGLAVGEDPSALQQRLSRWEALHRLEPGTICLLAR